MKRPPLLLAACLLPALSFAQDASTTQEAIVRAARAQAERATRAAYADIERYGAEAPVATPDASQRRARALGRLRGPLASQVTPPDERPLPFQPYEDRTLLEAYRDTIRARLNRLDPDRFAPRTEPEEPPPEELLLEVYDVQELVLETQDHFAPRVGLGANPGVDGAGGVLNFADESEDTGTGVDADKLIELIESELGEEDWEGSVEYTGARLVVRKSARAHAKIKRVLKRLAARRGGLVDLEVRLYRMPPTLFAELRSQASALGPKAEVELTRATADGRATLLSSHRVIAHDGQRVYVRRGGSRSFVADLSVNQTGVVPVVNPVVNVLNEGLVVEVRPIVDRERQLVLLDVALSLSALEDPLTSRLVEGIELELPAMGIARTGCATCVPLGRAALLGGVFKLDGDGDTDLTSVIYVKPNLIQGR